MTNTLNDEGRALLFTEARSANRFLDKPVPPALLRELYDLMKWAPTSANGNPARITFLTSEEARARLIPALNEGNIPRVESAPVTAILAYDVEYWENLPRLYPAAPAMKDNFAGNAALAETHAFRNGTLQGGYFILAARALGLNCGAMSGFNNAKVDEEFFAGTSIRSNFLCCIGYTDAEAHRPRGPRMEFDEFCQVL